MCNLVGGLEHFILFHMLGIIIPTDLHIFQRGRAQPPRIFCDLLRCHRICFIFASRNKKLTHVDPWRCRQQLEEQGICIFSSSWVWPRFGGSWGCTTKGPPGRRHKRTNLRVAKKKRLLEDIWSMGHNSWCGCRNWPIIGSFTAIIWCNWVLLLTYTLATKYHNYNMFHISFRQRGLLWHCWTFHHLSSYNLAGTKHLVES